MPLRNIFKKYVIPNQLGYAHSLWLFSSGHYHILSGLFLAYDIYRPKYSATSPFIIGTYRNNKDFLYVAAGLWAVSVFLLVPLHSGLLTEVMTSHSSQSYPTSIPT